MTARKKAADEKFCTECGEIIRAKAEICPLCGCRQPVATYLHPELDSSYASAKPKPKPPTYPAIAPRTRNFLYALLAAMLIVAASGEKGAGSGIFLLALLGGGIWLLWRMVVGLYLFAKPVREAVKPQVNAFNNHLEETMQRSGLGAIAKVGKRIDSGIEAAISETQKELDARYGHQGLPSDDSKNRDSIGK